MMYKELLLVLVCIIGMNVDVWLAKKMLLLVLLSSPLYVLQRLAFVHSPDHLSRENMFSFEVVVPLLLHHVDLYPL